MEEYVLINAYPEKLTKKLKITHPIFKDVVFEYEIKDGYKNMKFLGWRFANYEKVSTEINKINYADLEDYGLSLEDYFYSVVEYIYQQIKELDKNKEVIEDLTDEGKLFYNYWFNKIKGV